MGEGELEAKFCMLHFMFKFCTLMSVGTIPENLICILLFGPSCNKRFYYLTKKYFFLCDH